MTAKAVLGTARARKLLADVDGARLAAGALTTRYDDSSERSYVSELMSPIVTAAIEHASVEELPQVAEVVRGVISHASLNSDSYPGVPSPSRFVLDVVSRLRHHHPELAWGLLREVASGASALGGILPPWPAWGRGGPMVEPSPSRKRTRTWPSSGPSSKRCRKRSPA